MDNFNIAIWIWLGLCVLITIFAKFGMKNTGKIRIILNAVSWILTVVLWVSLIVYLPPMYAQYSMISQTESFITVTYDSFSLGHGLFNDVIVYAITAFLSAIAAMIPRMALELENYNKQKKEQGYK